MERMDQASLPTHSLQHLVCSQVLNDVPQNMIIPPPEVSSLLWHLNGRDLLAAVGGQIQHRKGWQYNMIAKNIASENPAVIKINIIHYHRRGGNLLLAGDKNGVVKIYKNGGDFPLVGGLQVHSQEIRDITTTPASLEKIATCSDDSTSKIIDIETQQQETELVGHCSEVKCISWHSKMAVLLTGSKDYNVKLWDARASQSKTQPIATMYHHNNMIHDVKWIPQSEYCFMSVSKDATMRLIDIRNLTGTLEYFRAPTQSILQVEFHPLRPNFFLALGEDGFMSFWQIGVGGGENACLGKFVNGNVKPEQYNVGAIKDFKWHPEGKLVAGYAMDGQIWLWGNNYLYSKLN